MMRDRGDTGTGAFRGLAVVTFDDEKSAGRAIRKCNGDTFDGNKIIVREDRGPSAGKGGTGGSDGGFSNAPPRDWSCPACGELVFGSKPNCYKCNTPRPAQPATPPPSALNPAAGFTPGNSALPGQRFEEPQYGVSGGDKDRRRRRDDSDDSRDRRRRRSRSRSRRRRRSSSDEEVAAEPFGGRATMTDAERAAQAGDGEGYLKAKAVEPDTKMLGSTIGRGAILYRVIDKGSGNMHPAYGSPCEVHYKGCFINGEAFDSSYHRGEPMTMAPKDVIKGWTIALQRMVEGDKWEVIIPPDMGYGMKGKPPRIPPKSVLLFEMELIKIKGIKVSAGHYN